MINIKNLSFSFGENIILSNFSCVIEKGERVNISGVSGRGKTTLLRIISGLQKEYEGEVVIPKNARISVVFQDDVLLPWYTALENVEAVADKEKAKKWLERLGLGDALSKYPSELSGGMKRRVALCRALAFEGDILILDEAFKGLDEVLKAEIIEIIINEYKDKTVIFTSHDKDETKALATRVIEL